MDRSCRQIGGLGFAVRTRGSFSTTAQNPITRSTAGASREGRLSEGANLSGSVGTNVRLGRLIGPAK
eukprot:7675633-Pyramimonas_sp.AAC.1